MDSTVKLIDLENLALYDSEIKDYLQHKFDQTSNGWNFISTTYSSYMGLSERPDNTLYFLDNGQLYLGNELISNVKVVRGDFPSVIDSSMLGNFFISLTTGEMRYVGDEGYVNLSEIMTHNIVLREDNLRILVDKIAEKQTVTMPRLEVNGNTVVWTPSNIEQVEVLTPRL